MQRMTRHLKFGLAITSVYGASAAIACGTSDAPLAHAPVTVAKADASTIDAQPDASAIPTNLSACATEVAKIERAQLDVLLAQDTSYSMDFDDKWIQVKAAIESFLGDPSITGTSVGLQYFPLRAACSIDAYAEPAVPIALVPQVTPAIVSSLEAQHMSGGTPTVPLLEGAFSYMNTWSGTHAGDALVVILATDGVPDDSCAYAGDAGLPNDLDNVIALATKAAAATPPIYTFVIGVGSELSSLNQIAAAGGTQKAVLVDTTMDIEAQFLSALSVARSGPYACQYPIPSGNEGRIDFSAVNVILKSQGAAAETFVNVASAADCDLADGTGWYYDVPSAPTKVLLCPDACAMVEETSSAEVDVVFGCATTTTR